MTRSLITSPTRTLLAVAALAAAFQLGGCASTQPGGPFTAGHDQAIDTAATPDDTFVAGSYSLVAADAIGLATFGQQIVLDDLRATADRFAEAK